MVCVDVEKPSEPQAEHDDPMTRSSEPLRFPADTLAGPESLRQSQRSPRERSAASCEAWLQLRRECDSGKCLRRDSVWNMIADLGKRLGERFSRCSRMLWSPGPGRIGQERNLEAQWRRTEQGL